MHPMIRSRRIMHVHRTTPKPKPARKSAQPPLKKPTPNNEYLALIGNRVCDLRARRGMTPKILARASKVSERLLAQLESGEGNISILLLRQIAQALDTPVESLAFAGPEPPAELTRTTEFLRALRPEELTRARDLLLQEF